MTVNHPIIKYRLTVNGRIPEYLCKHEHAFSGIYGVNTNKEGYTPFWHPPQDMQYLGLSCGPIDPAGVPDTLEVIDTKQDLLSYITGISSSWTTHNEVVTGISTVVEKGPKLSFSGDGVGISTIKSTSVEYDPIEGEVVGVSTISNVSDSETTKNGVLTLTRTTTTITTKEIFSPFDPVAATEELWTKYETVNGL